MKAYRVGYIHEDTLKNHMSESGKAFWCDYDRGYCGMGHLGKVWVPLKLCKIGKPNDVGWVEIKVPVWFLLENKIEHNRVISINWSAIVTE